MMVQNRFQNPKILYYYLPNQSKNRKLNLLARNMLFGAGDAAAGEQGPDMPDFSFSMNSQIEFLVGSRWNDLSFRGASRLCGVSLPEGW